MICIGCPMGCDMNVSLDGEHLMGEGHLCNTGKLYAHEETFDPKRNVTTTVPIEGGAFSRLPVKTRSPVPKSSIMECLADISRVVAQAPIAVGDLVLSDVAGTGVDVVATDAVALCQ